MSRSLVRAIKNKIPTYRKAKGLTQQKLADGINCHRTLIGKIEADVHRPSLETALEIARFLECEPEDLFYFNFKELSPKSS